MGQVTDKIRAHIGEGELEKAIDTLVQFLRPIGGELYDQAVHQRGLFKSYMKDRMLGLANNAEEKNKISMAILSLASQVDQHDLENPNRASQPSTPAQKDFSNQASYNQPQTPPVQQQQPQAQQQPRYKAQCFFTGDIMQYYITENDQILAVNPLTNQSLIVGMKMPSNNFNFAWTYYVSATNIYYMVDHAGLIWGQNFGMPAQVGYVKYFN
ncbi:MAG: hypothetical protein CMN32_10225 [Saprospirales bacterium]|nr:hypothetical protein [Saprospirales bacterium]